jgi:hypothetical protein
MKQPSTIEQAFRYAQWRALGLNCAHVRAGSDFFHATAPGERTQRTGSADEVLQVAPDVVDDGQRGEIRTVADVGPSPCMIGTAELPRYFFSYAASMAEAVSLAPGSNVTS